MAMADAVRRGWSEAIHPSPMKSPSPSRAMVRLPPIARANISIAACQHGDLRRQQGYTAAMLVEESRILQVSIFNTIHNNLPRVDFRKVLRDVITIADEVDSQLKQAMLSFVEPASAFGLSVA